mgnify:CR=1 FL=1
MEEAILEVKNLKTYFYNDGKELRASDDLSYQVHKGECVAIIGESGSGKTVEALSILRLIPYPPGLIVDGQILFHGQDLLQMSDQEMRQIRGSKISMIFQEASTALDPVMTIGNQIAEALRIHKGMKKKEALEKAVELLRRVDIPNPEQRVKQYPHEFSGGMQQRAMIAMAMSCSPKVLIADEPTTALDVTIQAQIFELMEKLKREHDTAIMLITHDMGVVSELADDVAVMYMGSIVERGSVREVLKYPAHPYTAALLRSIPILHKGRGQRLEPIRGSTPDPYDRPKGCQFAPRCDFCCEKCRQEMPPEVPVCDGHAVRCWNAEQVYAGHREEVEAV